MRVVDTELRSRPLRRWRVSIPLAALMWLLVITLAFGLFPMSIVYATSVAEAVFYSVLFLSTAATFVALATPCVDLYPDRVVLGGWFRKPEQLRLADIRSVEPWLYGLRFDVGRSGFMSGPMSIGAKGILLDVLKVRTRGDRIAERIMREAEHARLGV